MKIFQLALLCFICVAKSYGQIVVEITKEKHPKRISTKVEIKSAFPGGDSSWVQSLEKKLNQSIPVNNGAKAGKYIVSVVFIVTKDGSLADILCKSDPGFGMCQQVVTAIKKLQKSPPGEVRPLRKSSIYFQSAAVVGGRNANSIPAQTPAR